LGRVSKKSVMILAGKLRRSYGTSGNLLMVHGAPVRVSLLSTLGERTHFDARQLTWSALQVAG
jgi:hypothetical protein